MVVYVRLVVSAVEALQCHLENLHVAPVYNHRSEVSQPTSI
jgi:hypothetical protein